MITHIWPGDTAWRRARKGDWLALPFGAEAFTAIIGDGSLSALSWPHDYRVFFAQAARVLEKAGVVAIRLFATPDETETTDMLKRNAQAGHCKSFHAFKWQLAMAMVVEARDPNIAVAVICNGFNAMFPDRGELAAVTGWSRQDIDTIDVYANSPDVYSFPTLRELRSTIPDTFENVRALPARLSVGRTLPAACNGSLMNDPLWQKIKSAAAELAWPPLTRGPAATLKSLARQLEATQWLAQNEIEQRQCAQLEKLAHHAMQHSPFFAARMKTAGLRASALCVRENL